MRVLILSCNTGEGHNSAGLALVDAFHHAGVAGEMRNSLELFPRSVSRLISDGHVFVYRHFPRLFGWGYRFEEAHTPKFLVDGCALAADDLWRVIRDGGFDTVICVHVFPALTLTEILRKYRPALRTYFVSTDYTCHPGVSETNLDAYFIPHATLAEEFVSAGIPRHKLVSIGIPICDAFNQIRDKETVRKELGLPLDRKIVLLSCGSMGCGPIRSLTADLKKKMPADAMLIAVCGSNTHLHRKLMKYEALNRVKILGFTHHMSDYMDAADLFLTKPGGLSTTEAFSKRLPLIYINAVPGCETRNLQFGLQHGLAFTAAHVRELTSTTCRFLEMPAERNAISQNMQRMFPHHNAERLCQYVLQTVGKTANV